MDWKIDKSRAICPQICEQLAVRISIGEFKAEERLLSVRDVAVEAEVNPNTVQKSFEKLEEIGLIYSKRGSGWYVSPNIDASHEVVHNLLKQKANEFIKNMQILGISKEEIIELIKEGDYDDASESK